MQKLISLVAWVITIIMTTPAYSSWNNPYPDHHQGEPILYTAFSERPKHLDPVRSYSESEYQFLGQIYEPPLQYHYLIRPYRLEPQTLIAMPEIVFLDAQGEPLVQPYENSDIAFTEYHLKLQQGILYQPHPALAKDEHDRYRYHKLTAAETKPIKALHHLPYSGTREMVADDYIYQIKRIAHPALHSPIRGLMQEYIVGLGDLSTALKDAMETQTPDLRDFNLSGVKKINDYHFSIRIKGQYPQFIYWLAMPFFAPIPWEADVFYQQPGFAKNNISLDWYPIGTGAYMLTENNPNLRMTLEKNPNFRPQYYPSQGGPEDKGNGLLEDAGKRIPFIDKIIFSLEKESIPYWNKFLQGYFDSSGISSDSFDSAVSFGSNGDIGLTEAMQEKGIRLNTSVEPSIFYLGFNMLDPIIGGNSEPARLLRQAISIAIDYDEYLSIFNNGRGITGQSPIPPGVFGHTTGQSGINTYIYDWKNNKPVRKTTAYAKALMQQAGYPNGIDKTTGKPLVLYYESIDSGPGGKSRLNWLRKQLDKINIQLVIRSTDYNRFQEKMSSGKAQLFNWGWHADYPDPENFLFLLYGPQGKVNHQGENAANYNSPEFNQLFDQMKNMPDSPERLAIIEKMINIVRHDAPWAFGFHPKNFSLEHSWYKNVKPFIMSNTGTYKYKRIDAQQREQLREKWNQPIIWPVVLILLVIIGLLIPAVKAYQQRERSRAL